MFLVSIICFLVFSVIRGDPASALGGIWVTPEQLANMRAAMGLDSNVFVRYGNWLSAFIAGQPGNSLSFRGESVGVLISQRIPASLTLALLSFFLVLLISILLSLLTIKSKGSLLDRIVNLLTAAGISTPGFFLGLLFIFIFGFTFRFFIPGEYIDYRESFAGFLGCLFFPALAIAIPNTAVMVKFLRSSLFHELQSDYVRTAKSKGAVAFYILRRHILKNAIIPSIAVLGMVVADVLSGSVIIEQVFSIPGIGRLLIAAITSRDYSLIQALMVYIAFIVVAANALADMFIIIIDPRIRTTSGAGL
jgi:ABC-type dipeptide/oligopeptide/nickel transport system permease component